MAQNSPAHRVPSHGSNLFGERYAIDFVRVDDHHRTAALRDWRTLFAAEPPERFFAFGQPILAPASGTVVDVHEGEPDHQGRRAQLALLTYALGQGTRLHQGVEAIAGNYVTIELTDGASYVAMAHLRAGSVRVRIGQHVVEGEQIAECGNSGNSTQPHLHLQAMDSADLTLARGLPMSFRDFREWPARAMEVEARERGMPGERAVVEPLPNPSAPTRA
jgi:murein DD-endopeptidase MepM/ murein hydrolase activator NlpD